MSMLDAVLKMQGLGEEDWGTAAKWFGAHLFSAIQSMEKDEADAELKEEQMMPAVLKEANVQTFVEDMTEMVDEYLARFRENFAPDELELSGEIDEFSCYNSEAYSYPSKIKAKIACRECMGILLRDVLNCCDERHSLTINACKDFLFQDMESFGSFILSFKECFSDYAALMSKDARCAILDKKDNILGEIEKVLLDTGASEYKIFLRMTDWDTETKALEKKIFQEPLKQVFAGKSYLELCTYDVHDGAYCYEMYDAVRELHDDVENYLVTAVEEYAEKVTQLCKDKIEGCCQKLKQDLAEIL